MPKIKDPGVRYMQSLGIRPVYGTENLQREMERRFGRDRYAAYARKINALAQQPVPDVRGMWEKRFEEPDMCHALLCMQHAVDYRQICNYISQHRDELGKRILVAGCCHGVIAAFLAQTLPESEIVAIDRLPAAVRFAKEFAENRGVLNISFLEGELSDLPSLLPGDATFDSVLAYDLISENREGDPPDYAPMSRFLEILPLWRPKFAGLARALTQVLRPDGILMCFEEIFRDPALLGYMHALDDCGWRIDPDSYEALENPEAEKRASEQELATHCFVVNAWLARPAASLPIPDQCQQMDDPFLTCFVTNLYDRGIFPGARNGAPSVFEGWDAKLIGDGLVKDAQKWVVEDPSGQEITVFYTQLGEPEPAPDSPELSLFLLCQLAMYSHTAMFIVTPMPAKDRTQALSIVEESIRSQAAPKGGTLRKC
ncbi:MAG: methyltransferase domain-containing protein [Clostridia bacterium]|nr:methyltransferase domain-containing protein [Clostridia bacterium]